MRDTPEPDRPNDNRWPLFLLLITAAGFGVYRKNHPVRFVNSSAKAMQIAGPMET
jgi:hypothetical protein